MRQRVRVYWFLLALFLVPSLSSGQRLDMGNTYRQLDAETVRVTTYFADAYAVTERLGGGGIRTHLFSPDGQRLLSLVVEPASRKLQIRIMGDGTPKAMSRGLPVSLSLITTDWANSQAYILWVESRGQDALDKPPSVEWEGGFLRQDESRSKISPLPAWNYEDRVFAVETQFRELVAVSVREPDPLIREGDRAYATFKTEIFDRWTGERVGLMRWFEEKKLLAWDFPGLTEGRISEEVLPEGWTFRPTKAWANIQGFAFWKLHSEMALSGLLKDEPGCDGLHWLDDTIFRPCCDLHDRCYEKYGCTSKSWWQYWTGWSCSWCNMQVVICFVATAYGGGSGGGTGTCSGLSFGSCEECCSASCPSC